MGGGGHEPRMASFKVKIVALRSMTCSCIFCRLENRTWNFLRVKF